MRGGLRSRHRGAERRDAVIAAAFVVEFGRRPLLRFHHQPLFQHALDGAVQRPGAQFEFAAGARGHVLNDGVAVAVLLGHRHQNVKRGGRERQK